MKIAIIGATGHVGRILVDEALSRGHQVTGIARDVSSLAPRTGLTAMAGDLANPATLPEQLAGHDAVVSSVMFRSCDPHTLLDVVRGAGMKRYVVVGGAGSLQVAPGVRLIDTPDFPDEYREEASKGAAFLDVLRADGGDLDWTFLSPSALFVDGERTGIFRRGGDDLLVAGDDRSWISFQDYAVALIDELERPAHVRQRFTVGY